MVGRTVNSYFNINFVTSYDESEWAITFSDTSTAGLFLNDFPFSTALDSSGNWSKTNINPKTGNTYHNDYNGIGYEFEQLNYPKKYLEAYTNVHMMNRVFNSGITILQKVGNSFKELLPLVETDAFSGKKIYKIKICE